MSMRPTGLAPDLPRATRTDQEPAEAGRRLEAGGAKPWGWLCSEFGRQLFTVSGGDWIRPGPMFTRTGGI